MTDAVEPTVQAENADGQDEAEPRAAEVNSVMNNSSVNFPDVGNPLQYPSGNLSQFEKEQVTDPNSSYQAEKRSANRQKIAL